MGDSKLCAFCETCGGICKTFGLEPFLPDHSLKIGLWIRQPDRDPIIVNTTNCPAKVLRI
jgi:hypothetical protein